LVIIEAQAPTPPPAPHARAKFTVPKLVLAGAAQTCTQLATEVLPAGEVNPPAHASHAAPPGSALNEPAGQAAQASGGPEKPALHWQVVVPAMKAALRRHIRKHAELACAPAGELWPAGQAVQGVLPSKLLLPARHVVR